MTRSPHPAPPPAAHSHKPDDRGCVLGLDVGGTGMKGAVFDSGMKPLASVHRPTPRAQGPGTVVDAVADALAELGRTATEYRKHILHAGVVVPGIVDEDLQKAVWSANIGWRDLPLAALLQGRTGLPVTLGHDVRAGGLAEGALGAARGARESLFVAIGTGISASVISDGRSVRSGGYAGELGHVVVEADGDPCACGGTGCLETVASASAVAAAYTARTGRAVSGAADVAALTEQGDPAARAIWNRAVDALACALATAVTLFAPQSLVIGGGLAEAGRLLFDPVEAALAARLTFQRRPVVLRAELGDRAGCLGAGLIAWQEAGRAHVSTPTGALTS
ncbi:ROK family protein [Streptomyces sp. HNM0663]|uniref:ROK family protein n=1 Tax=Streptomyces chengmaiensis TaxID=3040919 RepID=A0ABT6HTA5_9ACTN|nr:ROK family protein [Streptomyces chengmaiensis]MDH2391570.1 ROK family protein [Streptomyces chengmaiensis]